jgi:hypothetical protein
MNKHLLSILLLVVLGSCATGPDAPPANSYVDISKVGVYRQNPSSNFSTLGKVEGEACRLAEAKRLIKTQAALLKANSIVNYSCVQVPEKKWSQGCRRLFRCRGLAVRIK